MGPGPARSCYRCNSAWRSGVRFFQAGAFNCDHACKAFDQRSETSERTEIRVRTSSLRLLSWVDVASMLLGQRSLKTWQNSWNLSAEIPTSEGWAPTSLHDTRRSKQ